LGNYKELLLKYQFEKGGFKNLQTEGIYGKRSSCRIQKVGDENIGLPPTAGMKKNLRRGCIILAEN
jgi:hypothetical protein